MCFDPQSDTTMRIAHRNQSWRAGIIYIIRNPFARDANKNDTSAVLTAYEIMKNCDPVVFLPAIRDAIYFLKKMRLDSLKAKTIHKKPLECCWQKDNRGNKL